MTPRFTIDGSDVLESHLANACEKILQEVQGLVPPNKLEALLLGGGYGRGEGGVLSTMEGDRPYNDLEFYLCLRGSTLLNERRYHAALHALGETLAGAVGVDVEFKILSLAKLRRSPVNMFYYDLVMGHRWLRGEESLLKGCEHHREGPRIPLSEAARLLMNRCSGLLFARQRWEQKTFKPAEADFVRRNLAKAQLAFGDAVLTAHGQYHWSCRERHERLKRLSPSEALPWLPEVRRHHASGFEFKLHPQRTTDSWPVLQIKHAELSALGLQVWLWLESRRLEHSFHSAADYALSPVNKCPETKGWRNRLISLRSFGGASLLKAKAACYPRERLFHALALLLWKPALGRDLTLLQRVQNELWTTATEWAGLVGAYQRLWRQFN